MFADEEMEQDDSSEQPADEPESSASADDAWTTAPELEKVDKKAAAASPKAEKEPVKEKEAEKDEGWEKAGRQPTVTASSTGEKEKTVPEPAAEAAPASTGSDSSSDKFPGSLLSSMGIEDPNTQRWVLIGAGIVIVLCCGCACIAIVGPMLSGLFSTLGG